MNVSEELIEDGIKEGIKEGIKKGRRQVREAERMALEGLPPEVIVERTGLSLEDVLFYKNAFKLLLEKISKEELIKQLEL